MTQIPIYLADDGSGPDKIAHISGPPERCEHAAQIINDLLQSIRVREEGQGVGNNLSHVESVTYMKYYATALRLSLSIIHRVHLVLRACLQATGAEVGDKAVGGLLEGK